MTKGARIKALRDNFGLTQDELAEKIGTTKQTIYKYETGIITNIPSDKIETMASLFDVSPSYLMGWNDAGTPSSDSSLTDGEQQIVSSFRQLNEEGRERLPKPCVGCSNRLWGTILKSLANAEIPTFVQGFVLCALW